MELAQSVLGLVPSQTVLSLVDAIRTADAAGGMRALHMALDGGSDPRALARQIVEYLRAVMLFQMGNGDEVEAPADLRAYMAQHASSFSLVETLRLIKLFNQAATDLRGGWQPSLPLELALAEALERPSQPGEVALSREAEAVARLSSGRAPQPARPSPKKSVGQATEASPSQESPLQEGVAWPSLSEINKAWKQIRAIIKPQSPSLDGLLNSCKLLEVKDGVLILGFASDILRSKAETPEQIALTERAIAEVLGIRLGVRCVVTNARQGTPPEVQAGGMVAAALRAGGEIIDVQE